MPYIKNIYAREVLDSRGYPTISVEVYTQCGACGSAIVPSGASSGIYEAMELRDMQEKRYFGQGVLKAVSHVNKQIAQKLCGMCVLDQVNIDRAMMMMDSTGNKGNLGANAVLGVSIACAQAAAACLSMPLYRYLGGCFAHTLPIPLINMISGGKHCNNGLSFQEFMILPSGASDFKEGVRIGAEIFHQLGEILKLDGYSCSVSDEGGFAPALSSNEKALALVVKAIAQAGYQPGKDVTLALDAAAPQLWVNGAYHLCDKENMAMTTEDLLEYYEYLCDKFPIRLIEDGLDQDDWDGWCQLTQRLGHKTILAGDDFFVSNVSRMQMGVQKCAGNGVLIKPNQAGTLTEVFSAVEYAKRAGYAVILSHRLGDSEDTFLADLAVAANAGYIKTGAVCRAERTAKYNRLIKIEDELDGGAVYGS